MKRRKFINATGLVLAGSSLPLSHIVARDNSINKKPEGILTAKKVNDYLRSLIDVKEPSVDRIIIGDPDTEVKKIGTAWMPYWETCREAVNKGINVLIVHEPTFYSHWDMDEKEGDYPDLREKKAEWIMDNGLVIIRCHDVWDKYPETGIPFALGQALGFSNKDIIRSETYYNVYKTTPLPAIDMAARFASILKEVGQPGVAFYGEKNREISSIGIGTGCICDPRQFMHLDPDMFVAIDDSVRTWVQTTFARDTGKPLVVINHGTSEEYGIRLLSKHLSNAFSDYEVIHIEQGCTYDWVEG